MKLSFLQQKIIYPLNQTGCCKSPTHIKICALLQSWHLDDIDLNSKSLCQNWSKFQSASSRGFQQNKMCIEYEALKVEIPRRIYFLQENDNSSNKSRVKFLSLCLTAAEELMPAPWSPFTPSSKPIIPYIK